MSISKLNFSDVKLTSCFSIAEKLSYVMSLYYQTQSRSSAACDFGGNAQLNSSASTVDAAAAAKSCITNPSATFIPGSFSGTPVASTPHSGGFVSLMDPIQSLGLVMGISAVGALWILFP